MSEQASQPASKPVFEKCVRCDYLLRGLPANHACPECGLRFDQRCELYRVTNPKVVLAVWAMIFGGGWVSLKGLRSLGNWATASAWQKVGVFAAVAWIILLVTGVWFFSKHYRRGHKVAITGDGLFVHLPGYRDELIPWADIAEASVKPKPKARIATVLLKAKQKELDIGGLYNLFPKEGDVERFVAQVNERAHAAAGE